jgi:hypothetical protein
MRIFCFALLAVLLAGCEGNWNKGECPVRLSFEKNIEVMLDELRTKGGEMQIPDTNDFILVIYKGQDREQIFKDLYKNKPQEILLDEGEYTFGVYSIEFDKPAFNSPQFGDEQTLHLDSEGASVVFDCKQMNSGLKLTFQSSFTDQFPDSHITLRQESDALNYYYDEQRVSFFRKGKVEILLSTAEKSRQLLSRTLDANEILTIHFSADLSGTSGADISIAIDTGRVWINEDYIYGKERDGSVKSRALTLEDLPGMIGSEDVWVKGYIAGGDLSSSGATYVPPFTSRSNLMISDRQSANSREGCASVELKSGKIRDSLNLVDFPENLGKLVYVKGKIVEAYFGLPGIKNVSEYSFN